MNHKIINIEKLIPDAYHGTVARSARNICAEGFKSSAGEDPFLGDGVYFFENGQTYAMGWARKRFSGEVIGVLKSTVNLGKCLDLHDAKHIELVKFVKGKLTKKEKKITDAVVINFIAVNFASIDSVRATYISSFVKDKIFDGSRFYDYVRLIICIRNLDYILKTSLVYEGE